ncbi:MAG: transferase, partial [Hyphomonadaceae bacterium]
MSRFVLRTRADCPDLKKAAGAIEQAAWNALGFLNYTHAHYQYYSALLEEYADCQLCLVDTETGYPVAAANCVPVTVPDLDALPAEGWDWIVESAASPKSNPNMIGALAISVPQLHRSKGLARIMIHAFRDLAAKRGYAGVVAPVRPSAKSKHPYIPIDDYVEGRDERGRAADPGLRSHLAAGG